MICKGCITKRKRLCFQIYIYFHWRQQKTLEIYTRKLYVIDFKLKKNLIIVLQRDFSLRKNTKRSFI